MIIVTGATCAHYIAARHLALASGVQDAIGAAPRSLTAFARDFAAALS